MSKSLNISKLQGGGIIAALTLSAILTYSCSQPPQQELEPTRAPQDTTQRCGSITVTVNDQWAGHLYQSF